MLYKVVPPDEVVPWRGEPIDGKRYPLNIEYIMSDEDLASIGLYKEPPLPPHPADQVIRSKTLKFTGNGLEWDCVMEPIVISPAEVYDELRRRAEMMVPYQKQISLVSRKAELEAKAATSQLTAEETSELDGINQLVGAIAQLSQKADALVSMNPIPLDFREDKYWQ